MLQNKAYAAYANNKIMTASPAELTLMLYDGAIKFLQYRYYGSGEGGYPAGSYKYPQG